MFSSKKIASFVGILIVELLCGLLNSVSAQAATTIGGVVNSNLTLTKSQSPFVLESTLQIPAGISVTVEPGVEISSNGIDTMFWNQGSLTFSGTRANPIRLLGKPSLFISIKNAPFGSQLRISGVLFNGGGTVWSALGYSGYTSIYFEDNEVKDLNGYFYVWYPSNKAVIQRNVFINSGGLSVGFSEGKDVSIINNLFIGPSKTGYWIESWAAYGGQLEVHNNEFRDGPYLAVQLKPDYRDVKINASSNYWGTTSLNEISKMVNDRNDGLSYLNIIDISNPLTQPSSLSPTYSILIQEAAEAKVKADAEAKAAAELKARQETAAKVEASKKITITCIKGKTIKKVTAIKPICPAGYKKKL